MTDSLERRNAGWLGPLEAVALRWLTPRVPPWFTPDRLTGLGFLGSVIALAGYAWTPWNTLGLVVATLGLAINWLGDSLDGAVARWRRIERPRYGYFLDNAIDVAQQFLVTVGVGLSGLIRWDLCFLAFSTLLMLASLTFIRAKVSSVHTLSYGGFGLTETRVIGMVLNIVIFFAPPDRVSGLPMTYPNILSLIWSLASLAVFAFSLVSQVREMAREDPPCRP